MKKIIHSIYLITNFNIIIITRYIKKNTLYIHYQVGFKFSSRDICFYITVITQLFEKQLKHQFYSISKIHVTNNLILKQCFLFLCLFGIL